MGGEGVQAAPDCLMGPPPSRQPSSASVVPTKLTHGPAMALSAKLPRRTERPHAGAPWWWSADAVTHRPSGRADGTPAGPATAAVLRGFSVGG